ncbi:unnamed protein product [Lactuca saligna]|uniref:Ubiquitin-like protease family profile domain-containing protein n=1 Tax=Lactuca saligna TaxID=75948 RepID=A0AA35Z3F5_LACSI|nr:unnamed protein product [Lactuca saligna]
MKEKLNSKLNDAMTKFPEKEKNEDKEGNGEEDSDNGASQLEVDYLLDSNEADNEEIKNDADKNQKEGEIGVKENDGKRNENENDEEEKDDHAEETNNHEETIQQTENENFLDKVVDNIMDNVFGIGISSLNSQEDEIWNHPEMKTIFDNIDIGSPMSTDKTNTLEENEKSEGVHEQGTKVEKTNGDDTDKENSEDRNEGGTEAKNTKDGGKKKSKNENKKREKADKTKGNKRDTHPSFSLGLSQDSNQTSSKKSIESSPKKHLQRNKSKTTIRSEEGPSKHDLDQPREKKLADAFKSPFKCRIIDTKPKLTHQDSIVCEWLFNLQSNTSDLGVQTKYVGVCIFFPVVRSAHIFVIVFNLKKLSIEILDNSAVEEDYEGKYGVILKPLKNFVVRYFKEINHLRANVISKESIKPQLLEMSWRTVKNKVDCGVFAMRHMETYMGQPLSKWKPGLHKESAVQQTTLEKLRQRYAHIMLTSEINMLKAKVLDLVEKYKKLNSKCVLIMHTRLC